MTSLRARVPNSARLLKLTPLKPRRTFVALVGNAAKNAPAGTETAVALPLRKIDEISWSHCPYCLSYYAIRSNQGCQTVPRAKPQRGPRCGLCRRFFSRLEIHPMLA